MELDQAQVVLAASGVAVGAVMVIFGVIGASWPGALLIIVGAVVFGNGVWFVVDARRRVRRRRDQRTERGGT